MKTPIFHSLSSGSPRHVEADGFSGVANGKSSTVGARCGDAAGAAVGMGGGEDPCMATGRESRLVAFLTRVQVCSVRLITALMGFESPPAIVSGCVSGVADATAPSRLGPFTPGRSSAGEMPALGFVNCPRKGTRRESARRVPSEGWKRGPAQFGLAHHGYLNMRRRRRDSVWRRVLAWLVGVDPRRDARAFWREVVALIAIGLVVFLAFGWPALIALVKGELW